MDNRCTTNIIEACLQDDELDAKLADGLFSANDYLVLKNKPSINGITLQGNKGALELGLVPIDLSEFERTDELLRDFRNKAEMFVDDKASGARITLQAVKGMSTKILRVGSIERIDFNLVDKGDYVFVGDENTKIYRVEEGNLVQVLPETTAGQVLVKDSENRFEANNVENVLKEIADDLDKKADVVNLENGTIIVNRAVADKNGKDITTYVAEETDPTVPSWAKNATKPTYTKEEVGLGNVDNTADIDKTVKEANRVLHRLIIGDDIAQASFNGSADKTIKYSTDDFDISTETNGISIAIKDKGYAKQTDVKAELDKKLDNTGGAISGDLTIEGNLKVNGEVTEFTSTTLLVADKLIDVARGNTEPLTSPAGILVEKADGEKDFGIVVDGTNTLMAGKAVKDSRGNIDVNASDLKPIVTRNALIHDTLVKWDGVGQNLVPDQRKYTQADNEEQISAEWVFTNSNGLKTNAIKNINGDSVYEFDNGDNKFGSITAPLHLKGQDVRPKYTQNEQDLEEIALLKDVENNVPKRATNAENVTSTINGKKIADIFESDGTTVKNATNAARANVATRADTVDIANAANRVANALRISGQNGNGTEQVVEYNGSAVVDVAFDEIDFNSSKTDNALSIELQNTGVLDDYLDENSNGVNSKIFSAVEIDAKGRAIRGGQSIEFGKTGQIEPSESLMQNGLYLQKDSSGAFSPYVKTSDNDNGTKYEAIKIPYNVLANPPSLANYTDKTADEKIAGAWRFENDNGLYTNTIHNNAGNAIYHYNGANVYFGSLVKPTILRGINAQPQYAYNYESEEIVSNITTGVRFVGSLAELNRLLPTALENPTMVDIMNAIISNSLTNTIVCIAGGFKDTNIGVPNDNGQLLITVSSAILRPNIEFISDIGTTNYNRYYGHFIRSGNTVTSVEWNEVVLNENSDNFTIVKSTTPSVSLKRSDVVNGTNPTSVKDAQLIYRDANGVALTGWRSYVNTDGSMSAQLYARSFGSDVSNFVALYSNSGATSSSDTDKWHFSPNTNANIDLGASEKHWRYGYVDTVYSKTMTANTINGGAGNAMIQQATTSGSTIKVGSTKVPLVLQGTSVQIGDSDVQTEGKGAYLKSGLSSGTLGSVTLTAGRYYVEMPTSVALTSGGSREILLTWVIDVIGATDNTLSVTSIAFAPIRRTESADVKIMELAVVSTYGAGGVTYGAVTVTQRDLDGTNAVSQSGSIYFKKLA